jgi:hypothetical protein
MTDRHDVLVNLTDLQRILEQDFVWLQENLDRAGRHFMDGMTQAGRAFGDEIYAESLREWQSITVDFHNIILRTKDRVELAGEALEHVVRRYIETDHEMSEMLREIGGELE